MTNKGGQLMFYASATTVYNAKHDAMSNGTGLTGTLANDQPVAAFAAPGSDSTKYFYRDAIGREHQRPTLFP